MPRPPAPPVVSNPSPVTYTLTEKPGGSWISASAVAGARSAAARARPVPRRRAGRRMIAVTLDGVDGSGAQLRARQIDLADLGRSVGRAALVQREIGGTSSEWWYV